MMLPENGMRFILTLLKRSLDPEESIAARSQKGNGIVPSRQDRISTRATLRYGSPTNIADVLAEPGRHGKRGCRACGGPMWGRGPAATSPASRSLERRRMPGLCCTLAGTLRNKPGTTSRCVRTNRRDEVFTSTSFRRIIGQGFHLVSTRSP